MDSPNSLLPNPFWNSTTQASEVHDAENPLVFFIRKKITKHKTNPGVYGGEHVDVSENSEGSPPQIIHFNRVFPYFHHPFWGFPPIFGNTHVFPSQLLTFKQPITLPKLNKKLAPWKVTDQGPQ